DDELSIAERIEQLLHQAMTANGLSSAPRWDRLFEVSGPAIAATIPDFDPYQGSRDDDAYFGTWGGDQGGTPRWRNPAGRNAVAYLVPGAKTQAQCGALRSLGMNLLLVWNGT